MTLSLLLQAVTLPKNGFWLCVARALGFVVLAAGLIGWGVEIVLLSGLNSLVLCAWLLLASNAVAAITATASEKENRRVRLGTFIKNLSFICVVQQRHRAAVAEFLRYTPLDVCELHVA